VARRSGKNGDRTSYLTGKKKETSSNTRASHGVPRRGRVSDVRGKSKGKKTNRGGCPESALPRRGSWNSRRGKQKS